MSGSDSPTPWLRPRPGEAAATAPAWAWPAASGPGLPARYTYLVLQVENMGDWTPSEARPGARPRVIARDSFPPAGDHSWAVVASGYPLSIMSRITP
jgi:hypothetical protein